jgi:hypothetical protein
MAQQQSERRRPVEHGQVIFGRFERAERREMWHVAAGASVLSAEERQVELGVVGGDRCASEPMVQLRDDIRENWSGRYIGVGDAVDVGRADRTLRIDTGTPLAENSAPRVRGHDRQLKDAVLVRRQSRGLQVDDSEARLPCRSGLLRRPLRRGRGRLVERGYAASAATESVQKSHLELGGEWTTGRHAGINPGRKSCK